MGERNQNNALCLIVYTHTHAWLWDSQSQMRRSLLHAATIVVEPHIMIRSALNNFIWDTKCYIINYEEEWAVCRYACNAGAVNILTCISIEKNIYLI